jgi:DNA-binding response OmpR family regulator
VTEEGISLLIVVDGEEQSRTPLLEALRRLGLRALAVDSVADAAALLEALDADLVLINGGDGDDSDGLVRLRQKSRVVVATRDTPLEQTVVALLRALGRPDEAALIN